MTMLILEKFWINHVITPLDRVFLMCQINAEWFTTLMLLLCYLGLQRLNVTLCRLLMDSIKQNNILGDDTLLNSYTER